MIFCHMPMDGTETIWMAEMESTENQMLVRMWKNRNSHKFVTSVQNTLFLKSLNIVWHFHPESPLLGVYSRGMKRNTIFIILQETCARMFIKAVGITV